MNQHFFWYELNLHFLELLQLLSHLMDSVCVRKIVYEKVKKRESEREKWKEKRKEKEREREKE